MKMILLLSSLLFFSAGAFSQPTQHHPVKHHRHHVVHHYHHPIHHPPHH